MDPDPGEAQKHVDPTDPDPQHWFPRLWLMNDVRRKTGRIDRSTQKWRTWREPRWPAPCAARSLWAGTACAITCFRSTQRVKSSPPANIAERYRTCPLYDSFLYKKKQQSWSQDLDLEQIFFLLKRSILLRIKIFSPMLLLKLEIRIILFLNIDTYK